MRRLFLIFLSCILFGGAGIAPALDDLVLDGTLSQPYYGNAKGNILTGTNCTITSGYNVTFSTFYEITLNPGFETLSNCVFTADVNDQTDSDSDGLPDWWEYAFFGDLSQTAGGDPDNDGMTNLLEYQYRTDPTVDLSDSDYDGLEDIWELNNFGDLDETGQGDFDNDGVANEVEFWLGTDPADPNNIPEPGTYYEYDAMGRIKKVIKIIPQ